MKRLTIAMVTTFYPPYNFGGDGVFVYRLAHALARDGHVVHVIHDADAYLALAGGPPTTLYQNHLNIIVHPLSLGPASKADLVLTHQLGRPVFKHAEIKRILGQAGVDLIHFHNISLLGGPRVLAYGNAIKLCTMHDYWFVCAMHVLWRFDREACTKRTCLACTLSNHRPPQLWRYSGAVGRSLRYVDAFIGASEFTCRKLAENGFAAPVRHLPHFLAAAEDDTDDGYLHTRPYFLYVGRLEKLKGVQVLLSLFREYRAADLLIVGSGSYAAELQAMAQDLPHVQFIPWIAHSRLRGLYRRAIAAVVPSLCYETFGLVPIEAFAARTPAIVHGLGALPELVEGSGAGIIYHTEAELLAALEQLRTQPELRLRMGERGYQSYLDNYTEREHLRRYYALIDELRDRRATL
jgi:glycosyltransferase involved in cell wall biosynthesis